MKHNQKLSLKAPIYKYNNQKTRYSPSKSPSHYTPTTKSQLLKYQPHTNSINSSVNHNNSKTNKSPIRKQLTPLKSPSHHTHTKKQYMNHTITPKDLFQKVCCPNCKYQFKIIKQEINQFLKQGQVNGGVNGNRAVNKKGYQFMVEKHVQTDGVLGVSGWDSPSKYLLNEKSNSPLRSIHQTGYKNGTTSRLSLAQSYQIQKGSQLDRLRTMLQNNQNNNQNTKFINESEYKFKPLSISPMKNKSKSSYLFKNTTSRATKIVSPHNKRNSPRFNYNNDNQIFLYNSPENKKLTEKLDLEKLDQQAQSKISRKGSYSNNVDVQQLVRKQKQELKLLYMKQIQKLQQTIRQLQNQLNNREVRLREGSNYLGNRLDQKNQIELQKVLKFFNDDLQQNTASFNQIKSFCAEISNQIQMPSYCKMLVCDQNLEEEKTLEEMIKCDRC